MGVKPVTGPDPEPADLHAVFEKELKKHIKY